MAQKSSRRQLFVYIFEMARKRYQDVFSPKVMHIVHALSIARTAYLNFLERVQPKRGVALLDPGDKLITTCF